MTTELFKSLWVHRWHFMLLLIWSTNPPRKHNSTSDWAQSDSIHNSFIALLWTAVFLLLPFPLNPNELLWAPPLALVTMVVWEKIPFPRAGIYTNKSFKDTFPDSSSLQNSTFLNCQIVETNSYRVRRHICIYIYQITEKVSVHIICPLNFEI